MAKLQDRAKNRASDARPYIERALKDEKVRDDVKSAIATARDIYDELLGGRAFGAAAAEGCHGQGHPAAAARRDRRPSRRR